MLPAATQADTPPVEDAVTPTVLEARGHKIMAQLRLAAADLQALLGFSSETLALREEELLQWEARLRGIRSGNEAKTALARSRQQRRRARAACGARRALAPLEEAKGEEAKGEEAKGDGIAALAADVAAEAKLLKERWAQLAASRAPVAPPVVKTPAPEERATAPGRATPPPAAASGMWQVASSPAPARLLWAWQQPPLSLPPRLSLPKAARRPLGASPPPPPPRVVVAQPVVHPGLGAVTPQPSWRRCASPVLVRRRVVAAPAPGDPCGVV